MSVNHSERITPEAITGLYLRKPRSVDVGAISHLRSDCKYTTIHYDGGTLLVGISISAIMAAYPGRFLLTRRGVAVACSRISGVARNQDDFTRYAVQLEGVGETFPMSRRASPAARRQIKKLISTHKKVTSQEDS